MSDQNKSNWDELASQLGAAPSDEVEQQPEARSPASQPTQPTEDVEYDEPTRPASGWDNLLGDFGIDAPAAKPVSPTPPPATARAAPPPAAEPEQPVAPSEPAPPAAFAAELQADTQDDAVSKRSDDTVLEGPADDEPADQQVRVEPAAEQASEPAEAANQAEQPAPSKWDLAPKSQLTLPDWFPFAGKRSKAPVAPAPETPEPAEEPPTRPESDAPAAKQAPADTDSDEEHADAPSDGEAAGGDQPPKEEGNGQERTGRRRRRRGRRRRSSSTPVDTATTAEEEAAEAVDESFAALGEVDEPQDMVASEGGADDAQEDADDDGATPKHRSVPSWGDAISVVVDANIAARSERKKFNSRGGSGGRGRRGGRRRKKPTS